MNEAFVSNRSRYLKSDSRFCPYCESERIIMGDLRDDYHSAWRKVNCVDCHKKWNDVYTITDVEERS